MTGYTVPVPSGAGVDEAIDAALARARMLLHRDRAACERLLDDVREMLRSRRDPERAAGHDQLRGDLWFEQGDLAGAARSYSIARRGWLASGRALEARLATLGRTRVMAAMGEYAELLPQVHEVQAALAEMDDADQALVTRAHLSAHQQLGEAEAALGSFEVGKRHLDLAEELAWDLQDLHAVGETSRTRGAIFLQGGLLHRALDELRRARRAFLDAGSAPAVAEMSIVIAAGLSALGEVGPATALLDEAEGAAAANPRAAAERDVVRAGVLLRAGLASEALDLSRSAEEHFVELGLLVRSARAAQTSAEALLRLDRRREALAELNLAEQLFAGAGVRSMRDRTRLVRARVAWLEGDRAGAGRIAAGVLHPDALAPRRGIDAEALILMARATDDLDAADEMLQEAALVTSRLGHVPLRLGLHLGRARHHRRADRRAESLAELRRAVEVGRQRRGRRSDDGRGLDDPPVREAVDELIVALVEDGGHGALIEAWQRTRAARRSALGPLIHQARGWRIPCAEPARIAAGAAPPHLDSGIDAALDVDRLLAELQTSSARVPIDDALPAVPEGPALDYYVAGEDVLAFVVREGQVHVRHLRGVAAESRHLVSAWQQECLMATVVPPGDDFSPALDALFGTLVAPLADLLGDLERDQLEVVAHDHLHAAPFDALLDAAGPWRGRLAAGGDLHGPDRDTATGTPVTALVLAVPDSRAPKIATEAMVVAAAIPRARLYLGEEATSVVLAQGGGGVDIIHVAGHGTFRQGNPLFSAVRLGDGWLRAVDIVDGDLRLDGAVVVLSACGTGLTAGDQPEPLGLVWAFLQAGAGGVVASLWDVDDDVTVQLMSHFYAGLESGLHPQAALGRARRAVAEKHPHPYYWAPFRYFAAP